MFFNFISNFTSHPKKVCMTYFQHFTFSIELSFSYLIYSYKAFIHAFIPNLYITSSSDSIKEIENKIKEVGCK